MILRWKEQTLVSKAIAWSRKPLDPGKIDKETFTGAIWKV